MPTQLNSECLAVHAATHQRNQSPISDLVNDPTAITKAFHFGDYARLFDLVE
jgi:hypothetical protein